MKDPKEHPTHLLQPKHFKLSTLSIHIPPASANISWPFQAHIPTRPHNIPMFPVTKNWCLFRMATPHIRKRSELWNSYYLQIEKAMENQKEFHLFSHIYIVACLNYSFHMTLSVMRHSNVLSSIPRSNILIKGVGQNRVFHIFLVIQFLLSFPLPNMLRKVCNIL